MKRPDIVRQLQALGIPRRVAMEAIRKLAVHGTLHVETGDNSKVVLTLHPDKAA